MEVQNDFTKTAQEAFFANHSLDEGNKNYVDAVLDAYVANKESIDQAIDDAADKWHINRMAKVDLAILRLAVTEIKYLKFDDVPESVAINEAVNIAKKYGSEDSGKFVNGVLGKIVS